MIKVYPETENGRTPRNIFSASGPELAVGALRNAFHKHLAKGNWCFSDPKSASGHQQIPF
jgi:hypothetical protein